jgi:hypothetical protein
MPPKSNMRVTWLLVMSCGHWKYDCERPPIGTVTACPKGCGMVTVKRASPVVGGKKEETR